MTDRSISASAFDPRDHRENQGDQLQSNGRQKRLYEFVRVSLVAYCTITLGLAYNTSRFGHLAPIPNSNPDRPTIRLLVDGMVTSLNQPHKTDKLFK
jgi:hypothetical protein